MVYLNEDYFKFKDIYKIIKNLIFNLIAFNSI